MKSISDSCDRHGVDSGPEVRALDFRPRGPRYDINLCCSFCCFFFFFAFSLRLKEDPTSEIGLHLPNGIAFFAS